jgi:hypothetical protein
LLTVKPPPAVVMAKSGFPVAALEMPSEPVVTSGVSI